MSVQGDLGREQETIALGTGSPSSSPSSDQSQRELHWFEQKNPEKVARHFYAFLKEEILSGNRYLDHHGQALLRRHYPFTMHPDSYPPELVATLYARRRSCPVGAILKSETPLVFDGGCGYGSDSILFAFLGAKVLAVDVSAEHVGIARKRKRYYEETVGRSLEIEFRVADLDDDIPLKKDLSLTWLSSVLAAVRRQEIFLGRVFDATRPGGKVMIVDFNLMNPLFFWMEWRRRRGALRDNPEFARHANFWDMVRRRGREGARFFPQKEHGAFDDVQFFTPSTLANVLRKTGFRPLTPGFSGFVPPFFGGLSGPVERIISRVPGLNHLGRAYVVAAEKS